MSEVIAPFFGVFGGFALDRLITKYKNYSNKKKLRENIGVELNKSLELLSGKGNLLPTTMWRSILTTGDIRLLSFSQRSKLSDLYFEIDSYNYEAKRVRDSAVNANLGIISRFTGDGMTEAEMYRHKLSVKLIDHEKKLRQKISDFLEKYWS